jgi:hypothetical protein
LNSCWTIITSYHYKTNKRKQVTGTDQKLRIVKCHPCTQNFLLVTIIAKNTEKGQLMSDMEAPCFINSTVPHKYCPSVMQMLHYKSLSNLLVILLLIKNDISKTGSFLLEIDGLQSFLIPLGIINPDMNNDLFLNKI